MERLPKQKQMQWLVNVIPYLIVFLCAFIAGVLMCHAIHVRPFGDRSLISMDMYWQYFPMYVQNAHPSSFSDAFYSWCGGFGFNNWSQNAYYCMSIFFLLFRVVPVEKMPDLVNWIVILKPAFAAMTMLGFLRNRCGKFSPLLMGGAVAYGLSSYMMAFFAQAMWTDCVIYAPLILLGLEYLLAGKGNALYMAMLAAAVISNFYISFAICLFLVFYVLTRTLPLIWQKDGCGFKGVLKLWLKFAGYSMIGGCIGAVVLIPVALTLTHTIASELGAPEKLEWYKNFFDLLSHLLPGTELVYVYDYANFAVGLLIFLTIPLYFLNKSIRPGERIAHGVLLLFLILSLNCNYLNYLWHGLHFPNQLPGRWTFLLCLYLVLLGTMGAVKTEGLTALRTLIGEVIGVFVLLLICLAPGSDKQTTLAPIYWLMILAASAALAGAVAFTERQDEKKPIYRQLALLCMTVAMVLQTTDSMTNFIRTAKLEDGGVETTGAVYFGKRLPEVRAEVVPNLPEQNSFYRMEVYPCHTFNMSMLGAYPGMTVYSSTLQGDVNQFMLRMGDWMYAKNVSSIYNAGSAVQNSLFGVRYVYSQADERYSGMDMLSWERDLRVYENPTALSLAYAVSGQAADYSISNDTQAIRNQTAFLDALIGESSDVFLELEPTSHTYENCTLSEDALWENTVFKLDESANIASFQYEFTADADSELILENNFRAGKLHVTLPDGKGYDLDSAKTRFACLGSFHTGDTVTIETDNSGMRRGWYGLRVYRFDAQRWQEIYQKLSAHELQITKFQPTNVEGTISLDEPSLVMATIPQDGGWRLYCDGKRLATSEVGDVFVTAEVPAGEHTLRYRYRVPGLLPGALISTAALLLFVWFGFPSLREKLLKKTKAAPKTETAAK